MIRGKPARTWILFLLVTLVLYSTASAQSRGRSPRFEDIVPRTGDLDPNARFEASTTPQVSAALAGPIDPEKYRLGPGDVLTLEYTGGADESQIITVDGEGGLRLPNLGTLPVAGRTLSEVRSEVVSRLAPFLPGADVDLRLIEPRVFKVYVVGAVTRSGVTEVRGSARVVEAIDAAGGLDDDASRRNIRVLRRDGRESIADLERFVWTGDWDANPYLEDGDRIVVPNRVSEILVTGAVARPGEIEYREGDTVLDVVKVAGGTLSRARLDSVLIIRFGGVSELDTIVVDFAAVRAGAAEDLPIQEDDRVFIRSIGQWHPSHQVNIVGEVYYPGIYAIQEGRDHISETIEWAGGFTPHADRKAVRILRRPEIEGQDVEFDRLSRLTRAEMTDSEYQTFRGKLAIRQSAYLIDFSSGEPMPPESDVLLKDGDIIEVERIELSVRIDGSVQRPGFISFEEGLTVAAYVSRAGGTTQRADRGGIRITRAGSNEAQRADSDYIVEAGDYIWVPEKKDTSFWETFKDVIAVAGQVAAIVILLDTLSR